MCTHSLVHSSFGWDVKHPSEWHFQTIDGLWKIKHQQWEIRVHTYCHQGVYRKMTNNNREKARARKVFFCVRKAWKAHRHSLVLCCKNFDISYSTNKVRKLCLTFAPVTRVLLSHLMPALWAKRWVQFPQLSFNLLGECFIYNNCAVYLFRLI